MEVLLAEHFGNLSLTSLVRLGRACWDPLMKSEPGLLRFPSILRPPRAPGICLNGPTGERRGWKGRERYAGMFASALCPGLLCHLGELS